MRTAIDEEQLDEPCPVRVRMLGSFSLEVHGDPIEYWRAGKARTLFKYLTLHRGRVVSSAELRRILWSADHPRDSSSLKVAVHAVRRIFAQESVDGISLVHTTGGYKLCAEGMWVDVEEFNNAMSRARQHHLAGHVSESLDWHRRALELYRGDFLAAEDDEWVGDQRQWLKNFALTALADLRGEALASGDWTDALGWCRRTLELDPCHERAYQELMQLHAERGDLGVVHDWYERCRRSLHDHLGLEPCERTERIRASALGAQRAVAF